MNSETGENSWNIAEVDLILIGRVWITYDTATFNVCVPTYPHIPQGQAHFCSLNRYDSLGFLTTAQTAKTECIFVIWSFGNIKKVTILRWQLKKCNVSYTLFKHLRIQICLLNSILKIQL